MIISYLKAIINISEEFKYDFKGIGPKEAMNSYF
jgi:hypothetical protein